MNGVHITACSASVFFSFFPPIFHSTFAAGFAGSSFIIIAPL